MVLEFYLTGESNLVQLIFQPLLCKALRFDRVPPTAKISADSRRQSVGSSTQWGWGLSGGTKIWRKRGNNAKNAPSSYLHR